MNEPIASLLALAAMGVGTALESPTREGIPLDLRDWEGVTIPDHPANPYPFPNVPGGGSKNRNTPKLQKTRKRKG